MTLQKKVYEKQALGIVGEFADNSPSRVAAYVLKANGEVLPCIGRAFSVQNKENEVVVGGIGSFAGIAIAPKGHAMEVLAEPSLQLTDGVVGEICSMGHIYVQAKNAVKPNNVAAFDPANGEIYAYASADLAESAKHTVIPNAKFVLYSAEAEEVSVLELNP